MSASEVLQLCFPGYPEVDAGLNGELSDIWARAQLRVDLPLIAFLSS
jgi:hypothetical protein